MAGFNDRGRHNANGRLWRRLDGKVKLEQFIAALRRIGHNELADKIEGMILLIVMPDFIWVLLSAFLTAFVELKNVS